MLSSILNTDLFFRNDDNMVLSIVFNRVDWGTTLSCNLLGGLISTSMTQHAYCATTGSSDNIIIRNFKGF